MSVATSPRLSAADESYSKDSPDRKVDGKLENRLNIKDLETLKDAFLSESDGFDRRLSLDRNQFCEALALILSKGSKDEFAELFDNIDVTKEGYVDWDKFASHMLLEFYEKDDRTKSSQVPQWKDIKYLTSPHKDVIQKVTYLRNSSRYIAISKEGCVSMWNSSLRLHRTIKTGTDSCKSRDLWVTNFVPLQNINKIALSFTSKEIVFYDLSSKLEFNCQYKLQGLDHTPLCLDYWCNSSNPNEAFLAWGDTAGVVNILHFNSANIALFERPPAPAGEKQEPSLNVQLQDISRGRYRNVVYTKYQAHSEWVRGIFYSQQLECFLSCSTSWTSAVVIGWTEKHTAIKQKPTPGSKDSFKKNIIRITTFQITQGVNDFDYYPELNLIATAGVNHHVCLWNPYVISKPNGVLRGHMASVIQVQFNSLRGQLISFSKDKVLRIWDVQLQVCIQRLAGMFPKGNEVITSLHFDESRNRLFLTFNYQVTVMEIKSEQKNRVQTHEKPAVAAIYNSVFNQLVSVCQSGMMIMWLIDSGQKVKQFPSIHGNSEVTCLTQDSSETRIFSGGTDGTVKIWDFNGHCYHSLDCFSGQPADIGQILVLKRTVIVIGWSKHVTLFRINNFREFNVSPADWKGRQEHSEDILAVDFLAPNYLATGSYDGEIVIWNTNSEQATRHLQQRMQRRVTRGRTIVNPVPKQSPLREPTGISDSNTTQPMSSLRPRSRAMSRVSENTRDDQNEFGWAISKLIFLTARKSHGDDTGANLVTCGGNGWVRFWNSSHNSLLAEFVAHPHAGCVTMTIDDRNEYLATGDLEGWVKVWSIVDYCVEGTTELITTSPPLISHFQPHQDMINSIEILERNACHVIITSSSDCSVALWHICGQQIGVFGQDEHWRIEQVAAPVEETADAELSQQDDNVPTSVSAAGDVCTPEGEWQPDERAVTHPTEFRVNTWGNTILGKDYQELRVQKRERRQPQALSNVTYPHNSEHVTHPPTGPYAALATTELTQEQNVQKPDAEKYFTERSRSTEVPEDIPVLAETLNTAFDEKSFFPKYILDFEAKMKALHNATIAQQNKVKRQGSIQTSVPTAANKTNIVKKNHDKLPAKLKTIAASPTGDINPVMESFSNSGARGELLSHF